MNFFNGGLPMKPSGRLLQSESINSFAAYPPPGTRHHHHRQSAAVRNLCAGWFGQERICKLQALDAERDRTFNKERRDSEDEKSLRSILC